MKRLFFLFLLLFTVASAADPIIRPAGFPYGSGARPTNGPTPGTTTRVPGTINRTGYSDNPSMWTLFIGGADQMCQDTNELYSINPKGRLEFQTAWVKDIGFGTNVPGMYVLKGGIDNTNWLQLAYISNSLYYPTGAGASVNIYNSDGTLLTDRIVDADGNDLSVINAGNISLSAGSNSLSINGGAGFSDLIGASQASVQVPTGEGFYVTGTTTKIATTLGVSSSVVPGWVFTATDIFGGGEWAEGAGANIANADLTFDGNHSVDGDTFSWAATNFVNVSIGALTNITLSAPDVALYLNKDTNSISLARLSGPNSGVEAFHFSGTEYARIYSDEALYISTPKGVTNGVNIGDILVAIGTDGKAEWTNAAVIGNQNFANTDLTFTGDRVHDVAGYNLWITNSLNTAWYLSTNVFIRTGYDEHLTPTPGWFELNVAKPLSRPDSFLIAGARIEGAYEGGEQTFIRLRAGDYGSGVETSWEDDDVNNNSYLKLWAVNKMIFESPGIIGGTVLPGMVFTVNDDNGVSEFATVYYRGLATGTPGTWVAATADIIPAYDSGAQPPEGAIAYLKFNANSVGSDTLQLGDSTTGIAITRANGVAIQADDITAGQYIMLIRAGTSSGSHWVCESCGVAGVAPSSGSVVAVDTAADLASETAAVVITQGYYDVGDGGHGAYRADSLSSETINNITVFDRSGGGRYLLMVSGAISAKQAGAVGDGTTDDHDALQGLFDVCPNLTARIEPLEYLVVGGLTLPDHVKVIARGADITVETTGEDRAVDMGSWCEWVGGTVRDAYQSGGTSGQDHCAFRIGDWKGVINHGVSNIVIRDVVMTCSGDFGSAGAFITQNSHNIDISNIEIPASATQGNGITVHWGWVNFEVEADGTRHPHNVRVKNVNIGAMTTSTHEGNAVACSAGYDISFENIKVDRCRYPIESTVGDFGFNYSGLTQKNLGSVSFKNVTCLYVYDYGAYIKSGNTFDTNRNNLNHVIENCTLIGANAGAGQGGLWIDNARNVTIKDTVIAGHEVGTIFTNYCFNVLFEGCLFATNRLGGFVAADPNTQGVTVRSSRFQNNGWGLSGTNAAAIRLIDGSNFRIEDNDIGNTVTEPNQEVGISLISGVDNVALKGNYVYNVKSGGVNIAYNLGGTSDGGRVTVFDDNRAASGITVLAGFSKQPMLASSADAFTRSFAGAITANRTYTLPDASITFARTDAAQTFTGDQTFNANVVLTDIPLVRDAAATLQIGLDSATPADQIIKGPDGSGTDKAGGKLTIEGGQSTGTGAGGAVKISTSLSGSSGSSANSYSTRSFVSAKPTDLTEASATTFCNITLPDAGYMGLRIATTVFASDGTDHQVSHVPITFSAINKAGTITISSITVPTATVAVSAGTLTPVTFTAVQNGNSVDVKCAATSSLTQTVLRIKWAIVELNSNGDATVTTF